MSLHKIDAAALQRERWAPVRGHDLPRSPATPPCLEGEVGERARGPRKCRAGCDVF